MRRWGAPAPVKVLAVVCTAVVVVAGDVAVSASSAQHAAGPTLTLVSPGPCTAPAKVLGRACAVTTGLVLQTNWTVADGSAQWNVPGQWQASYKWNVPATIPPAGASLTMTLTAKELIGGQNNRICPAMGVAGGVDLRVGGVSQGQPVGLGLCAEAGGSASDTKTMKLVPSSAQPPGTFVYVQVGLQDGPGYIYKYRAGAAKPPTCKAPPRIAASTRAKEDCRYLVRWSFNQVRQPIAGDLSVHRTAGGGSFRFTVGQGQSLTGEHCGKGKGRVVHVHEQITDDVVVEMKTNPRLPGDNCVRIPSSRPVRSLTVDLTLDVSVSNDPNCDEGRSARVIIRGSKTDLVTMNGCGHKHAYLPLADNESTVKVTIDIRPA